MYSPSVSTVPSGLPRMSEPTAQELSDLLTLAEKQDQEFDTSGASRLPTPTIMRLKSGVSNMSDDSKSIFVQLMGRSQTVPTVKQLDPQTQALRIRDAASAHRDQQPERAQLVSCCPVALAQARLRVKGRARESNWKCTKTTHYKRRDPQFRKPDRRAPSVRAKETT